VGQRAILLLIRATWSTLGCRAEHLVIKRTNDGGKKSEDVTQGRRECYGVLGGELQMTRTQNDDAKMMILSPLRQVQKGCHHDCSVTAVYKTSLQCHTSEHLWCPRGQHPS